MMDLNRREFLHTTGKSGVASVIGLTSFATMRAARAASANDKVILGIIGLRGRGMGHVAGFASRNDCEVAYLCDVDSQYFPVAVHQVEQMGDRVPKTVTNMKEIFDDGAVDAVVIATPDHWHALATIWACQASKDVYVEKPVSNNIWEGRQMVAASQRYSRIIQSGMQNRSAPYNIAAKEYIDGGKLGKIQFVRVVNQKPQGNFQKVAATPPASLDWNQWNGPAEKQDYNATMHQHWHSFWRYGGGEVTNDAIHQLDLARWVLGLDLPKTVSTVGQAYATPGEAETPDVVVTTFAFDAMTMVLEQTLHAPYMVKSDSGIRDGDLFPNWPQNGERIEIYGSEAMMILGRHGCGWQVFGRQRNRQPVVLDQMHGRFPDKWHHENFINCIRDRATPNAPIEEGHKSALMCHAANISYRVGNQQLKLNAETEQFEDNKAANDLRRYEYRSPYVVPELA